MNFVHFSTKMNNPLQYHTTNNIAKSGFCRYVHRVDSNLIVGKKFYLAAEPAQILSYNSLPVKNLLSVAIFLYMIQANNTSFWWVNTYVIVLIGDVLHS